MKSLKAVFLAVVFAAASPAWAENFSLHSPTIKDKGTLSIEQVFNGFGCEGKNISPALVWKNAPKNTQSFALTVYDPDAPTGSGWWHWVVVNIPASVTKLPEGAGDVNGKGLPPGAAQVRTDYGVPGFGGACPPVGDEPHRYIFTVYALKTPKIDLPENATAALAGYMIHANKIGSASFTARYGR